MHSGYRQKTFPLYYYTPGIYAEGYIVFVIPFVRSPIRMYVNSFIHSSVTLMGISQQPLIRKHLYLSHGYLGGSAYIS